MRLTPLSTVERRWRFAAVSSCTLVMVLDDILEISSQISFCSVTYFLKESTVCKISLGRLSSFTALSFFPVAVEPGRLEAGRMSTPPRPVVVEVAGVVAGVAWLKPTVLVELRLPRDSPVDVVVVVCPNPESPDAPVPKGTLPKRDVAGVVVVVGAVTAGALDPVAREGTVRPPNPVKLGADVVAAAVVANVVPRPPKGVLAAAVVDIIAVVVVAAVVTVTAAVDVTEPKGRAVAAVVVCGAVPNVPSPVETAGVEPKGVNAPVPRVAVELAADVTAGMPNPPTEVAEVVVGAPKPPAKGVAVVVAGVASAPKPPVGAAPKVLAGAVVPKPIGAADEATGVTVTPEPSLKPPNGATTGVVVGTDVAAPKPPNPVEAAVAAGSDPKPPKPVVAVDAGMAAGVPKPLKPDGAAGVAVPKPPNPAAAVPALVTAGIDPKAPNA